MHIFPVIIRKDLNRDMIRKSLLKVGISTGIHYFPNHFLSFYNQKIKLENTEKIYPRILTLPLHNDLEISDIDYIIYHLRKIIS